ncbi:hypothetical protein FQR65_LT20980 [Abscondita terminalis]|nr:hypothetical protein FQR65_LT20980 [Abscondita terminalis]
MSTPSTGDRAAHRPAVAAAGEAELPCQYSASQTHTPEAHARSNFATASETGVATAPQRTGDATRHPHHRELSNHKPRKSTAAPLRMSDPRNESGALHRPQRPQHHQRSGLDEHERAIPVPKSRIQETQPQTNTHHARSRDTNERQQQQSVEYLAQAPKAAFRVTERARKISVMSPPSQTAAPMRCTNSEFTA